MPASRRLPMHDHQDRNTSWLRVLVVDRDPEATRLWRTFKKGGRMAQTAEIQPARMSRVTAWPREGPYGCRTGLTRRSQPAPLRYRNTIHGNGSSNAFISPIDLIIEGDNGAVK